jgi:hypothetical protein
LIAASVSGFIGIFYLLVTEFRHLAKSARRDLTDFTVLFESVKIIFIAALN